MNESLIGLPPAAYTLALAAVLRHRSGAWWHGAMLVTTAYERAWKRAAKRRQPA